MTVSWAPGQPSVSPNNRWCLLVKSSGGIQLRLTLVLFTDGFYVTVQNLWNAVGRTKGSLDGILSSWMFLSAFLLLSLNCLCLKVTVFLCDSVEYLEHWDLNPRGSLPNLKDVKYSTCFYEVNYTSLFSCIILLHHPSLWKPGLKFKNCEELEINRLTG